MKSSSLTAEREDANVIADIIAHLEKTAISWTRTFGCAVKRLVEPARSVAMATSGVARDSLRSRTELIAENALLRQ